jgi:hypothetical protein
MDASVAFRIAERFGLSHRLVDVPSDIEHWSDFAAFDSTMSKNTYLKHGRHIAYLYWKTFGIRPTLHIRSNLAEIGQTFYFKLGLSPPLARPSDLTGIYRPSLLGNVLVDDAFVEFYEAARFDAIYDYDPYDMFYWEHRMGTWHSHVLIESDPGFDTHVVFNCRRILTALLSLPFEARKNGSVFSRATALCWPELTEFSINPEDWMTRYGEAPEADPVAAR